MCKGEGGWNGDSGGERGGGDIDQDEPALLTREDTPSGPAETFRC